MVRPYHLILHRAKLGFPRLDRLRAYRQRRGAGKRHSTTCVWQPPDPLPSIDSPPPFTRLTSLFDPLAYLNICLVQTTKGSWQNTMIEGTEYPLLFQTARQTKCALITGDPSSALINLK